MVTWEPFELPCGIEAAIHRLNSATLHDDFKSVNVMVCDGRISFVSLFDMDGKQHYLKLIGCEWFEMHELEGGE